MTRGSRWRCASTANSADPRKVPMQASNPTIPLPTNLAAERVVLGVLIEEDELLPEVIATGLKVDDFSVSDHQRIFRAMLSLREKKCPVDYITVAEQLGNRQEDYVVIGSLVHGVVIDDDHLFHHVAIVRRKARQRSLLKLAEWISESVNETTDPDSVIEQISARLEGCR